MFEAHAMRAMSAALALMVAGLTAYPILELEAASAPALPRFPTYRLYSFVEPADFSDIRVQFEDSTEEATPWLKGTVAKIAFTPDNSHLVVAGRIAAFGAADQKLRSVDAIRTCPMNSRGSGRWFVASNKSNRDQARHTSLAIHPDGTKLLCRHGDGNTRIHALPDLEVQGELDLRSADFHPQQPWIVGAQDPRGRLVALDAGSGVAADGFKVYPFMKKPATAASLCFEAGRFAFSRDGSWVAGSCKGPTGYMRHHLVIASTIPGHPCQTLPADDFEVALKVFFTPRNERLIALCRPKDRSAPTFVRAWNLADQSVAWTTQLPESVHRIAMNPDGRWFAAACNDHSIRMLSAQTGREFTSLSSQVGAVHALAFSSDGRLFGAAEANSISVWNVVY